jgi:hypothetical protein
VNYLEIYPNKPNSSCQIYHILNGFTSIYVEGTVLGHLNTSIIDSYTAREKDVSEVETV